MFLALSTCSWLCVVVLVVAVMPGANTVAVARDAILVVAVAGAAVIAVAVVSDVEAVPVPGVVLIFTNSA